MGKTTFSVDIFSLDTPAVGILYLRAFLFLPLGKADNSICLCIGTFIHPGSQCAKGDPFFIRKFIRLQGFASQNVILV